MLAAMKSVIVFVSDVEKCADFYRVVFELELIEDTHSAGEWCELDAGGCRLAFHKAYGADGPTGSPADPHKLVFYATDVAALRDELLRRGAQMDEMQVTNGLMLCDGTDPEGHRFQISNRA